MEEESRGDMLRLASSMEASATTCSSAMRLGLSVRRSRFRGLVVDVSPLELVNIVVESNEENPGFPSSSRGDDMQAMTAECNKVE